MNKNSGLITFQMLKLASKEVEKMCNLSSSLDQKQIKIIRSLIIKIFQAKEQLRNNLNNIDCQ